LATFNFKGTTVAGMRLRDGMIKTNYLCSVRRGAEVLQSGLPIKSLKHEKSDVKEVEKGEFGLALADFNEFKKGDIVEIYEIEEQTHLFEHKTKIVTAKDVKDK
jgi:translation initiation factor IF-2